MIDWGLFLFICPLSIILLCYVIGSKILPIKNELDRNFASLLIGGVICMAFAIIICYSPIVSEGEFTEKVSYELNNVIPTDTGLIVWYYSNENKMGAKLIHYDNVKIVVNPDDRNSKFIEGRQQFDVNVWGMKFGNYMVKTNYCIKYHNQSKMDELFQRINSLNGGML